MRPRGYSQALSGLNGRTTRGMPSRVCRVNSRKVWLTGLLVATGVATTGCGSFMARRLAQAPNTYPSWFAPASPVEVVFGGNYLTNFAAQRMEVGPPPARLCYRLVEPGDYQLEVTRATRPAATGQPTRFTIRAVVPGSPTRFTASPRGTVVLLHCYGLSQKVMGPWALRLAEGGWRCVLVDLRGHGRSSGRRIYFGVQEVHDLDQLVNELQLEGCLQEPLAVLGYSYGAALALRWATVEPRIRRVVAIGPYAELAPAVLNVRRDYAAWIPTACVKAGLHKLPRLLGVDPGELDTTTELGRVPLRALFVAGDQDDITPWSDVSRLHTLAAPGSELLVVPGATHESLPFYLDRLAAPVLNWLATPPPAVPGTNAPASPGGN